MQQTTASQPRSNKWRELRQITKYAEMGFFFPPIKLPYSLCIYDVLKTPWTEKTLCFTKVDNTLDTLTLFNTAVNFIDVTNISVIIFLNMVETLKWKCVLSEWDEKRLEKSTCPSGSLLSHKACLKLS